MATGITAATPPGRLLAIGNVAGGWSAADGLRLAVDVLVTVNSDVTLAGRVGTGTGLAGDVA